MLSKLFMLYSHSLLFILYIVHSIWCLYLCSLPLFTLCPVSLSFSSFSRPTLSRAVFACKPGPAQGFFLLKGSFSLPLCPLTWRFRLWVSGSVKHQLYCKRRYTNQQTDLKQALKVLTPTTATNHLLLFVAVKEQAVAFSLSLPYVVLGKRSPCFPRSPSRFPMRQPGAPPPLSPYQPEASAFRIKHLKEKRRYKPQLSALCSSML